MPVDPEELHSPAFNSPANEISQCQRAFIYTRFVFVWSGRDESGRVFSDSFAGCCRRIARPK